VRLIYWSATVAIASVLAWFAALNRERIDIVLWPFATFEVPLYVLTLAALLLGFLVGAVVAWIGGGRWRRKARQRARRIEALERELAATQARLPRQDVSLPARSGAAD
jgi:uncharacterized integral membrane protein